MAKQRSSSLPLVSSAGDDSGINPFWSQGVQADARLENARPSELPPVPTGNDDDLAIEGHEATPSSISGMPVQNGSVKGGTPRSQPPGLRTQGIAHETPVESGHQHALKTQGLIDEGNKRRSRSPSRREGMPGQGAVFRTPSSWDDQGPIHASDRAKASDHAKASDRAQASDSAYASGNQSGCNGGESSVGSKKQPEMSDPHVQSLEAHVEKHSVKEVSRASPGPKIAAEGDIALEREIERRMFEMMREENHRLRVELAMARQQVREEEDVHHQSFRSAVGFQTPEGRKTRESDSDRFTPQGTKLPSGPAPMSPSPPALPPLPPFPPLKHSSTEVHDDVKDLGLYEAVSQDHIYKGSRWVHPSQVQVGSQYASVEELRVRPPCMSQDNVSAQRCHQLEQEVQGLKELLQQTQVRVNQDTWGSSFHAWPGGIQQPSTSTSQQCQPSLSSALDPVSGMGSVGQAGSARFGGSHDVDPQLKSIPITLPKLVDPTCPTLRWQQVIGSHSCAPISAMCVVALTSGGIDV